MNNWLKSIAQFFSNRTFSIVSCVIGWVASAYLLYRSIQLNKGPTTQLDVCKTIFGSSCDNALSNIASWQLGYPIAGWGMAYFGLLAFLIVFNKPVIDRIIIFLSALGLGAGILLISIDIRQELFCPLCIGIQIINLFILASIYLNTRIHDRKYTENQKINPKFSFRPILFISIAVLIGFFCEVYILANGIGTRSEVSLNQSYEAFRDEAVFDFPKNSFSYKEGLINAPLQVVVFSSYQCPGCKLFNNSLANIKAKFGDNIRIDYKHFPLSKSCNPILSVDLQPQSCDAALAAIAAGSQGRYQEYHEQLFKSNLQGGDSVLTTIAAKIGLDIEAWDSIRHSERARIILMDDINMANAIQIHSTPTVFLNGRKVNRSNELFFTHLLYTELNHLKN